MGKQKALQLWLVVCMEMLSDNVNVTIIYSTSSVFVNCVVCLLNERAIMFISDASDAWRTACSERVRQSVRRPGGRPIDD